MRCTRLHRMRGDDDAVAAGHRPRRHRHADGGRAAAQRRRASSAPTSAREHSSSASGQWKAQSGGTIARRCAASATRSTGRASASRWIPELSRAVNEAFVRLHDEGLIYRGKRLVNWDPVLRTALSDLEVLSEEEDGAAVAPALSARRRRRSVVVATTRPETLLGDTAVAVHPDDERYRALIGRRVRLPLAGREIPIIADDYVDPAFGTGCRQDHPGARLQRLRDRPAPRPAADQYLHPATPRSTTTLPERLRGLDRFEARARVRGRARSRRPDRARRAAQAHESRAATAAAP